MEVRPKEPVRYSLHRRDAIGGMLALLSVYCVVPFAERQRALLAFGFTVFLVPFLYMHLRCVLLGWRRSMALYSDRIELLRGDDLEKAVKWDEVAAVRLRYFERMVVLRLMGPDGELASFPLPSDFRQKGLIPLLSHHLTLRVRFEKEVVRPRGPRGRYLAVGAVCAVAGAAGLALAYDYARLAPSSVLERLFAQGASYIAFLSIILLGVGICFLGQGISFSPLKAGTSLVPLPETTSRNLYPLIRAIDEHRSVPGRRAFAYPHRIREFDSRKNRSNTYAALGAIFVVMLACIGAFCQGSRADGRQLFGIVLACTLLFGLMAFMAYLGFRSLNEINELKQGFDDSVLVDGDSVHVWRRGQFVPAEIARFVRSNHLFRDTIGLNGSRLLLFVGDEQVWYDPTMMVEVDKPVHDAHEC